MDHLWLFALFVFGIIVLPGMDMAFVLASSLVDGRRAGLAAVAGMVAGGAVHTLMGALGLGLLLQLAPPVFNAVLAAGALYVAWMGVALWRSPATLAGVQAQPSRAPARIFARAMATCLLNPKAYVFMVAVFPQFVRPALGNVGAQVAAMGAIIAATQLLVYGGVAFSAAVLRNGLQGSLAAQARIARAVAALLVGTSGWSVLTGWVR
ncbi:LysE family translocator [Ramlibacter sp. USB13]|uniref:LysE family translocator n=1 Tax=Ramlibacter cellulosilyticus TaxID=2764187 RepID=A0A923S9B0_9BURK|nr:LysE family translocator [Ramlibacter cellulosilyticus]MBC5781569.1 LysE family translocator [Ramlibacter cellulosilyticus]